VVASRDWLSTRVIPDAIRVFMRFWTGSRRERLAPDSDSNVRQPHSSSDPHYKLLFIPDGSAEGLNQRLGREERDNLERWKGTYMRKTIKREAARKPV
jgi:hypothetical protein